MTHNGWTNYETWVTALWIDNDPGTYYAAREVVREHPDDYCAAQALEDFLTEDMPDLSGTLWGDLLSSAVEEINWGEIIETYRDEEVAP